MLSIGFVVSLALAAPAPPVLHGIVPDWAPSLVVGLEENMTLVGSGLTGTEEIVVDGKPLSELPHHTFTVVDDGAITFAMPLTSKLGPVDVTVESPRGSATVTLMIRPAVPPALEVGHGFQPEPLGPDAPVRLTMGGVPGRLMFYLGSLSDTPSILPGTVGLDIGGGFTSLVLIGQKLVKPEGWVRDSFVVRGLPPGLELHFQAAEYDVVLGTLPTPTTNVGTGVWGALLDHESPSRCTPHVAHDLVPSLRRVCE